MVPALREEFNRNFTPEKYRRFLENLDRACGTHVEFPVSETPCFVPQSLLDRMAQDGRELILQLVDNPEYRRLSDVTIPPQYNVPNEAPLPMFVQVDFGLVRGADWRAGAEAGRVAGLPFSVRIPADLSASVCRVVRFVAGSRDLPQRLRRRFLLASDAAAHRR